MPEKYRTSDLLQEYAMEEVEIAVSVLMKCLLITGRKEPFFVSNYLGILYNMNQKRMRGNNLEQLNSLVV